MEQVSPNEGVESIMVPYDEARPPLGDIQVRKVALRFLREQVLPIVDERGACIGVVFAEDCSEVLCYLPSLPWNPIVHKCLYHCLQRNQIVQDRQCKTNCRNNRAWGSDVLQCGAMRNLL